MDPAPNYTPGPQYSKDPYYAQPKCTWDGVQIPDPEELNPVPKYKYKKPPRKIPRPGQIDRDVQ
ncbi:hypothetical protein LPJ75_004973, partial [Coemansia sp. RSA 2598]